MCADDYLGTGLIYSLPWIERRINAANRMFCDRKIIAKRAISFIHGEHDPDLGDRLANPLFHAGRPHDGSPHIREQGKLLKRSPSRLRWTQKRDAHIAAMPVFNDRERDW